MNKYELKLSELNYENDVENKKLWFKPFAEFLIFIDTKNLDNSRVEALRNSFYTDSHINDLQVAFKEMNETVKLLKKL